MWAWHLALLVVGLEVRVLEVAPMPSGQAPSGMGCGSQLGGMNPSMSNLQNVLGLIGSWSDEELLALQSHLSDRFVTVQQRRMIPERFGARLDGSSTVDPFVPTLGGGALPIPGQPGSVGGGQAGSNQDIFAKSEKWLAPAPVPSSTQWRTREEEVYQWGNYLDELTAWAAQASLEFSVEIQHASRWPREITWNSLSVAQQARSRRLLAIGVFCEGVSLTSVSGVMGLSSQPANGFELFRQLTLEFSIRSGAEALSLRASLVAKSFTLTAQETTPGSVVSDTIRKLDYEMSRFSKLLGTLPSHIDTNGLRIGEADLLLILLKSLPESVKQYCLHHSGGESYDSYRHAARRWEEQQRLFGEFGPMNGNGNKKVSSVGQTTEETEYSDMTQGDDMLHAVGSDGVAKCGKCGSRKHSTSQCTVDLSKTKCFKCGSFGHVGMNCSQNKDSKGKGKKGVIKSDNWNKGKGKPGKGKGKKGKLNEVSEDSSWDWSNWAEYGGSAEDQWWYNDDASWWDGSWNTGEGSSTQYRQDETWNESGQQQAQGEAVVGSLILNPLVAEDFQLAGPVFEFCDDSDSSVGSVGTPVSEGFVVFENCTPVHEDMVFVDECLSQSSDGFDMVGLRPSFECGLQGTCSDAVDSSSLCCEQPRKIAFVRDVFSVDHHSEVSVSQQIEPFLSVLDLLLSQVADQTDCSWWLLDSGASTTVLAESHVAAFNAVINKGCENGFKAANGSDVSSEIGVSMLMADSSGGSNVWKKARLRVLVGNIRHNILSISALADSGWKFVQGPQGFDLFHTQNGMHCMDVAYYANCPWVRMFPEKPSQNGKVTFATSPGGSGSNQVFALSATQQEELEEHRRQGHMPFHPQCLECARGRSTFQHRRRAGGARQAEIQADFAFLSQTGEVSHVESERAVKLLVLVEMFSKAIGVVVVGETEQTKTEVKTWLNHFGLASQNTSVVVRTDAERAVGDLIGRSSGSYTFEIRRAAPQQHAPVGGAEHGVRHVKESLSVLRADLNNQGLDLLFSHEDISDCVTYLCLCHNNFVKVSGTDSTPLELISGKKRSKPAVSMFGSSVLAELPDSIKQLSPNETRNVEASFIHLGLSHGPVVQAKIRCDGRFELVRFVARNVRPIQPLTWDLNLCDNVLTKMDLDEPSSLVHDQGVKKDEVKQEASSSPEQGEVNVADLPPEQRRELKAQGAPAPLRSFVVPVKPTLKKSSTLTLPRETQHVKQDGVKVEETKVGSKDNSDGRGNSDGRVSTIPPGSGEDLRQGSGALQFSPTRRCPACESGMNIPGVRRNKECRKRFSEFQDRVGKLSKTEAEVSPEQAGVEDMTDDVSGTPAVEQAQQTPAAAPATAQPDVSMAVPAFAEVPVPSAQSGQATASSRPAKRQSDTATEELEREIRESSMDCVQQDEDFDWFWMDCCEPVLQHSLLYLEGPPSFCPATSPDMFSMSLNSIQYDNGKQHEYKEMELGGKTVLLWKPDNVIDDQTLQNLNTSQGFDGMMEELRNLEHCKTGRVVGEAEFQELKAKHPNLRLIGSRWVCAFKSESRVRARIVTKDFSRGATAKSLGFSSPTPSVESLHLVLATASSRGYHLRSLDISHAFMHSPLTGQVVIVLKLPLSVSLRSGEACYLVLSKSLNGLRDASLCWLNLLSETMESVGLYSDSLEPCVYGGEVVKDSKWLGNVMAIVYVDDILVASSSLEAEEFVVDTISKVVPTKATGKIGSGDSGSLTFIGRTIKREKGSHETFLGVNPNYLDDTFREYGVVKGSAFVPDVASHLEKTMGDPTFMKPLTDEAYGRFRKALGRLLWMSQTRHDIKAWMSVLGSQQSKPMHGTEQGLKAVLRFLFQDMHVCLCVFSNKG